jgi:hypothetical protein
MAHRLAQEPAYPLTQVELDVYCERVVEALRRELGLHLIGVLLCGSWARGEAAPPESDADITVIVDTVNDGTSDALCRAWRQADMGCANIYGADEVVVMEREAVEMYTTNAILLWGHNPFLPPTTSDFVEDLARVAERVARSARALETNFWMTLEEQVQELQILLSKKGDVMWALRNVAAFRTGTFPQTGENLRQKLIGTEEATLMEWITSLTEDDCRQQVPLIARRLSLCAHAWFHEIAPVRLKMLASRLAASSDRESAQRDSLV